LQDIFGPALAELSEPGFWGPASFRDYVDRFKIPADKQTQKYISIDHLSTLSASLRDAQTMVLRLGESDGVGTQFGLVRTDGLLRSFFLHDTDLFQTPEVETFLPRTGVDQLFPFHLVGNTAETNLVSYGFASGLLGTALKLDDPERPVNTAGGNGRQSFLLRPHSSLPNLIEHRNGQVETDALFVATRGGRQHLFILEAKVGRASRTLAKHKLMYPVLGVRGRVPTDMPIVPVYVRIWSEPHGQTFAVAECSHFHLNAAVPAIDELSVKQVRVMRIPSLLGSSGMR